MKKSNKKSLFEKIINKAKKNIPYTISFLVMILSGISLIVYFGIYFKQMREVQKSVDELKALKEQNLNESSLTPEPQYVRYVPGIPKVNEEMDEATAYYIHKAENTPELTASPTATATPTPTQTSVPIVMTEEAAELYGINNDYVGWLKIDDTVIDYPVVMGSDIEDDYYLKHWFDKTENKNGTLFTLPSCETGIGYAFNNYENGIVPTTNIIIFGHDMGSGEMFGKLKKYLKQDYFEKHRIIEFDTAYEHREYEVISVFRSHVFESSEDAFRYYYFFNADTQEEFDYWVSNITEKNEITADFSVNYGDEFITLSTCNSTNENGKFCDNGRLAVVAVRIK